MNAKELKFKVEVCFSKNRHYPEYGEDAYSIESHSIYIPYGKLFNFSSSKGVVNFVKNRIDEDVLKYFSSVSITNWRGYGGSLEYLKQSNTKSDSLPIDKQLAEITLSI